MIIGRVDNIRSDMDNNDILQKIVDSDGSCEWASPEVCSRCPLGRLKKRQDGINYLSCADALGIDQHPSEDHNKLYKDAAKRLLLDMSIEDLLTE